jgi:diadenosine tetraphosphate (Ap4A) HIT family hydrolase
MSRDIFCDIKENRENFVILQENNYATIIIDQNQSYKGHLLIIPDTHSRNISQVDETT